MLKETIKRISHMIFLNRCQIPGYYRLSKSNNGTVKQWSYNSNSKSKPKKKIGLLAKMRPGEKKKKQTEQMLVKKARIASVNREVTLDELKNNKGLICR